MAYGGTPKNALKNVVLKRRFGYERGGGPVKSVAAGRLRGGGCRLGVHGCRGGQSCVDGVGVTAGTCSYVFGCGCICDGLFGGHLDIGGATIGWLVG